MSNEPSPRRRGLALVISSPSGAGKTSLSKRLIQDHPDLVMSVSATTRDARPGEVNGREYVFVSHETFAAMVEEGAFLEHAEVHENRYGSPRAPVLENLAAGRDVLFDIDWQGAMIVATALPADTVKVFILPPSMPELAKRLRSRAQDADDVIARRLGRARGEIAQWSEYDYVIVNEDFESAYRKLAILYQAERLKRSRNLWLRGKVAELLADTWSVDRAD